MEKNLIALALDKKYTPETAKLISPLTLAWIGDSVFSDLIRHYLVASRNVNVNHLTKLSTHYVCAHAQAEMIRLLLPFLTDEEQNIFRRGRNAKSTPPKHADLIDYRYATGLESLWGYLSLIRNTDRLRELTVMGIYLLEQQ